MVDINPRNPLSSPPDRRLLAKLTQDPKLIRYLENLWTDTTQVAPDNFGVLLELIVNAAEVANASQGSANVNMQAIEELGLAIEALDIPGAVLQRLGAALDELANLVQSPDQAIQGLQRKVDELENMLVEFRPPIIPPATPLFAPALANATAAYAVAAAPPYQPLTVRADATAAAFTVALPAVPEALQLVTIKKVDASANVVTIDAGALLIDGAPTIAVGVQFAVYQLQYNGAGWDVVAT